MNPIIDFYFDYSSPYGYLASERIEAIAMSNNHRVVWHPVLLGAVFKITGQSPLTEAPLKGDYSIMDFARSAREHGLNYQHPNTFPIATIAACRATLWMRDNADASIAGKTTEFVHLVFRAYYAEGRDITDTSVLAAIAISMGIDSAAMLAALGEPSIKDALRSEVETAIEIGVFGSPMMIVNGEKFWGNDRLEQLDRWLQSGGW